MPRQMVTQQIGQCERKTFQVHFRTQAGGLFAVSSDLIFKNDVDSTVYASKRADAGLFSKSRRQLYRGPPEWDDCIATIDSPTSITLHRDAGDVELHLDAGYQGDFTLDGRQYAWAGFSEITDSGGDTWLSLKKPWFSRKLCELYVASNGKDMLNALIATFVARHWGHQQAEEEEEYQSRRRSAAYVPSSRRN